MKIATCSNDEGDGSATWSLRSDGQNGKGRFVNTWKETLHSMVPTKSFCS